MNQVLGLLTIFAGLMSVLGLIYLLLPTKFHNQKADDFLAKQGIVFAFIITLTATLGSLFYSEIANYTPCELCWYQRIFMYPQVILFGLAWLRKESQIIKYNLSLSIFGFIFALYHSYIAAGATTSGFCSIAGGVSCLQRYVYVFNYITIPIMALAAFSLIIVILIFTISKKDK